MCCRDIQLFIRLYLKENSLCRDLEGERVDITALANSCVA